MYILNIKGFTVTFYFEMQVQTQIFYWTQSGINKSQKYLIDCYFQAPNCSEEWSKCQLQSYFYFNTHFFKCMALLYLHTPKGQQSVIKVLKPKTSKLCTSVLELRTTVCRKASATKITTLYFNQSHRSFEIGCNICRMSEFLSHQLSGRQLCESTIVCVIQKFLALVFR